MLHQHLIQGGIAILLVILCQASCDGLASHPGWRSNTPGPSCSKRGQLFHWISRYPAKQMYSNQCFWQVFHTIPFLNLTFASTLFTNYRTSGKILHTFYLPDSELSSAIKLSALCTTGAWSLHSGYPVMD